MREPDRLTAASTIHVAARPAYNGQRSRSAFLIESKTKARSYSITITGAVTIDSLHAIPSAQATIAAACHEVRLKPDATSLVSGFSRTATPVVSGFSRAATPVVSGFSRTGAT